MAKQPIIPSIDPAACYVLDYAQLMGIPTAFSRAAELKPCTIGSGQAGVCCKNCYMGPCRITKDGQVGVCGATLETIAARNLARAIAAGAAAHSDHGAPAFTSRRSPRARHKAIKSRRSQTFRLLKHAFPRRPRCQ
jgi:hydroxylamine reductase (hybrid-cluster protein)